MRLRAIAVLAAVLLSCMLPARAGTPSFFLPRADKAAAVSVGQATALSDFSSSDGVGTWNTCGIIISPSGAAETAYGTTIVDSSGQATATNHAMDGTTWTDTNAFTISPDGRIQMNGADWGVMSYDRNTTIGYDQRDGSVCLSIGVRAGSGYTLEEAIGHWRINALQVGSVWTGWTAIDADLDATGALTGTIVDSDGGSNPFSAQVSISPDGVLSAEDDTDLPNHAFMSTNGQFFVQVAGAVPASGAERIDIGMLGGGDFITADLAGEWHFYTITEDALLFEGTFTAVPDGSFTGTNHNLVHDITYPISGTVNVTQEGVITFTAAGSDFEGQGTLSLDRSTFVFVFTDHAHDGDLGFMVGTKHPPAIAAQTTVDVTHVSMDWGNGFSFDDPMDLDTPGLPCGAPGIFIHPSYFSADPPPPSGSSMQASYYFGSESHLQDPVFEPGKLILTSTQLEGGDTREARFIPTLIADSISWPVRTSDIEVRAVFDNLEGDLAPPTGEGENHVYAGFDVNHDDLWWDEVDVQFGFFTMNLPDAVGDIPAGDYHEEPYLAINVYGDDEGYWWVRLAPEYDPAYPVELKVVITTEKLARFYAHFGAPEEEWVLVGERQVDWWPDADALAVGCGSGMSADVRYAPRIGLQMWYDDSGGSEPLEIVTEELPDAQAGVQYDQMLEASGGSGEYEWQIVQGDLPYGLNLNSATGQISGTPSNYSWNVGCRAFTVQVSDPSTGETDTQEFTMVVGPNMVQEILGEWGFHSISVMEAPGSARGSYGSISFDPSGTATVNRVQPDGSVATSTFAYTVHPDGSIDSDGRHWGNLSFDHKRIVATGWDETQGVLTICGRRESDCEISQFDAEGTWTVHSFEVGPSWQGWREIEGEIDEWGRFSGTRTASDGSSGPYLADVLVADGELTIHEAGNRLLYQHSNMSSNFLTFGSVMGDAATQGTGRFDVGIRTGGDFITEDLKGTWHFHGVSTWGNIGRGTMEVAADGTFVGDFFDSDSEESTPISGWLDVSADGSMSMEFDDGDGQFQGEGTLSMDRAYFVFTEHEEGGVTLIVAVKEGETVESQVDVTHVYMNWGNGFVLDDPLDADIPGTPCGVEGVTAPDACLTHPTLEEGGIASALYASDRYPLSYQPGRITLKSLSSPFGDNLESEAVMQLALENTPWVPQTQDMELRATFENLQGALATPVGSSGSSVALGFAFYDEYEYLGDTMIYLSVGTGYFHRGYLSLERGYYNRKLFANFGCWVEDDDSDAEYLSVLNGYDLSQPVELRVTISPSGLSRAYLRFLPSEEWMFIGEGQSSLWPGAQGWASGCYSPNQPTGIMVKPFVACDLSYEDFSAGPVVSPETIPDAVVGIAYSQEFYAWDNAWGNVTWSIADGTLPPGLTLSEDGVLGGTPTEAGSFQFTVRVEDGRVPPASGERTYDLEVLTPVTIQDAKALPDNATVMLSDVVVTRPGNSGYYLENRDRSAGILLADYEEELAEGTVVTVTGTLGTYGLERCVRGTVTIAGSGAVRPVGMAMRSLGGTDYRVDPGVPSSGQRGVEGGSGLNNIGLLVKIWGKITQFGADYLYVDDGSAIADGTVTGSEPNIGVRVIWNPVGYALGDKVEVTGISSCFRTPSDAIARRVVPALVTRVGQYAGEMVHIPAGSFLMGNNGSESYSYSNELPQHSVDLSGYWIGKYEVTRGEYSQFMNAGGYSNPAYWSSEGWSWRLSASSFSPSVGPPRTQPHYWAASQGTFTQTDNHPVIGVDYYEAEAFCNWAGGHLPTEAQWEKAARWTGSYPNVYPWGNTWDQEKCNNWSDSLYPGWQTAPVGSYPSGVSPYGCHDMAGNVFEWVKDWFQSNYYSLTPSGGWINPQGPAIGNWRVLRGGSLFSYFGGAEYDRCAYRDGHNLNWVDVGFRLAR